MTRKGELAYCDEEKRDARNHNCLHQRWLDFRLSFKECLQRTQKRGIKGAQYIRPKHKQVVLGMTFEHCSDELEYHDRNNEDLVCVLRIVYRLGQVLAFRSILAPPNCRQCLLG